MFEYTGKAFKFGDNINTDYIIPSHRKKDTLNVEIIKKYIMEDIRPHFYSELNGVSIIVAGSNFGCGSAMEVAAQVVRASNIPVILAKSFARSYFRNAINNGILIVEMNTDPINENDTIHVAMDEKKITVEDVTNGYSVSKPALRKELADIIVSGGLIQYVRRQRMSHQ